MNDQKQTMHGPLHSIDHCPVCGGGLCGIRISTGDDPTEQPPAAGFVMCDECEAIWLEPDVSLQPTYTDPESPLCPICGGGLWGSSRWANWSEVESLGWASAVNRELDADLDDEA